MSWLPIAGTLIDWFVILERKMICFVSTSILGFNHNECSVRLDDWVPTEGGHFTVRKLPHSEMKFIGVLWLSFTSNITWLAISFGYWVHSKVYGPESVPQKTYTTKMEGGLFATVASFLEQTKMTMMAFFDAAS